MEQKQEMSFICEQIVIEFGCILLHVTGRWINGPIDCVRNIQVGLDSGFLEKLPHTLFQFRAASYPVQLVCVEIRHNDRAHAQGLSLHSRGGDGAKTRRHNCGYEEQKENNEQENNDLCQATHPTGPTIWPTVTAGAGMIVIMTATI